IMKRIFILLTLTIIISAISSASFAAVDEARDAMIVYSGTEAFTRLLPEERQACMYWVYEGGAMNETCRGAVRILISEAPDAVTNSQRRALLAAASGYSGKPRSKPIEEKKKPEVQKDNTGALVAAGVAAVILGLVIHNNIGRSHSRPSYGPPPPPYRHYRHYAPCRPRH
ncbi:MAG: hypothetical protein IJS42_02530, partial [Synergistaceae bacterium]|nr:hypothetical protein [Synergistaceae bacterium]